MIKNLSLKNKLILILLILFLPLMYFSINSLIIEKQKADSLDNTYQKLQEINRVTHVMANIQKERALTQGFLLTDGENFKNQLKEQRLLTDESIRQLHPEDLNATQEENMAFHFSRLNQIRLEIDAAQIDSLQLESFFVNTLGLISEKLEISGINVDDADTKRQLDAYVNLLKTRFYLGQIRTFIIRSAAHNYFTPQVRTLIAGRKSLLDNSRQQFLKYSDNEIISFYNEIINNDIVFKVENLINEEGFLNKNEEGHNLQLLFDQFSQYSEILKEVDDFALAKIQSDVLIKKSAAEQRLWLYIAFVISMLVLAVWLSIYIINHLLYSVSVLKKAADKVAIGDANVSIPILSNDEIGSLAHSFRMVVDKNNHLTNVSNEIGKGNYAVDISAAYKEDILANALRSMKENLKLLSDDNNKRNWILTGASEINDLVTGDNQIASVAKKCIDYICQYVHAELGAFYILNELNQLELTAGYAFSAENPELKYINPSNNFIGQVLYNNKIERLKKVKSPEFRIKTGITESNPAEVLMVPLYMQEQAVGILELASRKRFTDDKLEFLEHIDEKIAIVLVKLQADLKNAELLAETQSQAEELESQQEELRQSNHELLKQKSKLQESEEELRANQEELEEKNVELEEKAKQLEEHYEAIRHKNKELEEARNAIQLQIDELHRVGKYKADFLANMSHELRTPLNSILILAKLISENRDKNLTHKQIEFAEVIHTCGNDLLKLINEILDLTKIEAGKLTLEVSKFPVVNLNQEPQFRELANEKKINFEVSIANNVPEYITSDQFRVEQILKNLLSNAFKFTGPGGKVLLDVSLVENREQFANTSLNNSPKIIAFAVHDSGIGISEDDQKVIFDAFRQADSSTTRKFGGTGLGLSISKELAQLLGGAITVTSEMGKGSCFTLFIPETLETGADVEKPVEKTLPQALKEETGTKNIIVEAEKLISSNEEKTILIIEDDKGFSKILADFAKSKKIEPVTTHLGKKGIEIARQIKPSAILLDIQLPDISGWEVLDIIRQDSSLKNIPVHIMSAYDLKPTEAGLAKENYLPKPVSLESLDKAFYKINRMKKGELSKVLIIEDNVVESNAVKELLLAHELNSEIANSGEEAFAKLREESFDCIILDISLPGMGGYEVLEKLKNNKTLKNIPVIVYSGKDFSEEEEFKLKKYVNAIVIKTDYSYKRLLDEVKLFLHKVQEKLPANDSLKLYKADESLKGKKVLIVDDDSRNIYSLYNAFENEQMDIVVANNGVEALAKLEENRDVNIVLMDIMMPEMDGLECTRRIRKNKAFATLPIIALTAKAMKEDKQKCLEAGVSDYVTKPVNVEKLLSLMRVWMHRNENIIMY